MVVDPVGSQVGGTLVLFVAGGVDEAPLPGFGDRQHREIRSTRRTK